MTAPRDPVATTIATWVYVLHAAGSPATHDRVRAVCESVAAASNAETGDAAGLALIDAVASLIGDGSPDAIRDAARALYGGRAAEGLGAGDRDARNARIRRYQFAAGLPWLARIWERRADGAVTPGWVIVERLTDQVTAMDPNPWNDVDEERTLPVGDFHVLWELDGCRSLHLDDGAAAHGT